MSTPTCTTAVTRLSDKGTPKLGYDCPDCQDFRNQVEIETDGHGGETYTQKPCHCVTDTAQEVPR